MFLPTHAVYILRRQKYISLLLSIVTLTRPHLKYFYLSTLLPPSLLCSFLPIYPLRVACVSLFSSFFPSLYSSSENTSLTSVFEYASIFLLFSSFFPSLAPSSTYILPCIHSVLSFLSSASSYDSNSSTFLLLCCSPCPLLLPTLRRLEYVSLVLSCPSSNPPF